MRWEHRRLKLPLLSRLPEPPRPGPVTPFRAEPASAEGPRPGCPDNLLSQVGLPKARPDHQPVRHPSPMAGAREGRVTHGCPPPAGAHTARSGACGNRGT